MNNTGTAPGSKKVCEVCAVFGVGPHWSDSADSLERGSVAQGIVGNRAERAKRLTLINQILAPHGVEASDWDGEAYCIEDAIGRRQVVADLSKLWQQAERLAGSQFDPLTSTFLKPRQSWSDSYRASN